MQVATLKRWMHKGARMELNKDTYVTLLEADGYVDNHYTSTSNERIEWAKITPEDKEIYLKNACIKIELLIFVGEKYDKEQTLTFPRKVLLASEAVAVPQNVKRAQIEEAIEMAIPTSDTEETAIKAGAVIAYSIGHLSESFNLKSPDDIEAILVSSKAQQLLRRYLGGAFDVR